MNKRLSYAYKQEEKDRIGVSTFTIYKGQLCDVRMSLVSMD